MAVDLVNQGENVLAGAFLARATYGAEYIDKAFWVGGDNDAEKADDYRGYIASQAGWQLLDESDLPRFNDRGGDARFTGGGLYDARVDSPFSNSFDAQGLLAVKDGDTLVLAFRGTDGKDPAVQSGQAFTGQGIAAHYKAFKPLINAALAYLKEHPEITDIVVSGHSLGGAMADIFALVDADRFRALRPDGLTIVSVASSGVPKDVARFFATIDQDAATLINGVIDSLTRPADYISLANSQDRAHFPKDFPDIPEDLGLIPIVTLKDNLQFGGDLLFDLPNIGNSDVQYYDVVDHPFDFRGMGAEHNSALLWANLQGLIADDLFGFYEGQSLTAGITDYNRVPDHDGKPVALFLGYLRLDDPRIANDRGDRALIGTGARDYILGLDGNDRIDGDKGRDLLSGSRGADRIDGGGGGDILSGGAGRDVLRGGRGEDVFHFGAIGGKNADVVLDFKPGSDRLSVEPADADASLPGNQAFTFVGEGPFTGLGQVRAVQDGNLTLLRFNTAAGGGDEMTVILRGVDAADLRSLDFIL